MRTPSLSWLPAGLLGLGLYGVIPTSLYEIRTTKLILWEWAALALVPWFYRSWTLRWLSWWTLLGTIVCYNARALVVCWRLTLAFLVVELLARTWTPATVPRVLRAWRWLTVVHTTYMLLQTLGIDPMFVAHNPLEARLATGWLDNTTIAAAYTTITLPLWLAPGWTWMWLLSGLALIATQSVGAVLVAAGFGAWVLWHERHWRWWWALAVPLLLLTAYSWSVRSLPWKVLQVEPLARGVVWWATIQLWSSHWWSILWGWGPGQFAPAFRGIMGTTSYPDWLRWDVAHNEWVQLLFEQGLGGLALWGHALWQWCTVAWAMAQPVVLIAVLWLVMAGGTFPAHHPGLAVVGIVLLGLLEGTRRQVTAPPASVCPL